MENLPITSDTSTSPAPAVVSHRLTEFMNGKATSREPICCGMMRLARPDKNGIAMKKIMMVPWDEKIWSKWPGGR